MGSPAGAFRSAVDALLTSSPGALSGIVDVVRVYVEVPANATLPYVLIGNDQVILTQNDGCADEAEIFSTVQWWSRTSPRDKGVQCRQMGSALVDALATDLTVSGWEVVEWECQSEEYSTDPDQSSRGRAVFRYLLTEIVA